MNWLDSLGPSSVLLIASGATVVVVTLASLFWPRDSETGAPRGLKLLKSLAVVIGIILIALTTSIDKGQEKVVEASVKSLGDRAQLAEVTNEKMKTELIALKAEVEDLRRTLGQTSKEKKEAAAEAERLGQSLLETVRTVAEPLQSADGKLLGFRFKEVALFDTGRAELNCNSREKISKVVGYLIFHLKAKPVPILVVGHTDNRGSDVVNDKLSTDRAVEVKKYLVSAGIPDNLLTARGLGKRQPSTFASPQNEKIIADSNNTEDKKTRNRRVELLLSPEVDDRLFKK